MLPSTVLLAESLYVKNTLGAPALFFRFCHKSLGSSDLDINAEFFVLYVRRILVPLAIYVKIANAGWWIAAAQGLSAHQRGLPDRVNI